MLETSAPQFSLNDAVALAYECFGIAAAARPLTSERDQNFHLRTAQGEEFVLKIANASEAQEIIAFQNAVMRHFEETDPGLPVPHLVPTRDGALLTLERGHIIRVLTWRSGRLMHQVEPSALLRGSLGHVHARLSRALSSCAIEAPQSDLLWDLQRAAHLRPLLAHAGSSDRVAVLQFVLDRFEARALPWLQGATTQIIHNDLNPHNVVVDEQGAVSGVIDFGDMVRAPLICDVAVAAAYHVRPDRAPMGDAQQYLNAFCEEQALSAEELALLPDLIAMRLAMTVLITNWRASLYPDNRAYILRNEPNAWRGLIAMAQAELQT